MKRLILITFTLAMIFSLAACGKDAVREHGKRTLDVLNNECCRMIGPMMGAGTYRMNAYFG